MLNKRVLVTGGHGFLGVYVVQALQNQDWVGEIFTPTRKAYDLREKEAVINLYQDTQPDIVIHLAAVVGGIGVNRTKPAQFFFDNQLMGLYTLHYAHQYQIEKFVAIGTVCAYPKLTSVPFKEETLWQGYPEETNAPYGLAKKMLFVQGQAYRQQYGFNTIYLLPTNLYGPGDTFDLDTSHVIPALIRKFTEAVANQTPQVTIWGDGSPTREFLYVTDCAEAIVLATRYYDKPEPVNIGLGVETSIKTLVELIAALTGFKGEIVWDTTKPNGQPRRCLDTSRAKAEFNWQAKTPLAEGLARTVAWYQTYYQQIPEKHYS